MKQDDLFPSGGSLKQEGIQRAWSNAKDQFRAAGVVSGKEVLAQHPMVRMDMIRRYHEKHFPDIKPHTDNAWGALMHVLASKGLCRPTGGTTQSDRPSRHEGTQAVWTSLIYKKKP